MTNGHETDTSGQTKPVTSDTISNDLSAAHLRSVGSRAASGYLDRDCY
jgi:hypothetical protein